MTQILTPAERSRLEQITAAASVREGDVIQVKADLVMDLAGALYKAQRLVDDAEAALQGSLVRSRPSRRAREQAEAPEADPADPTTVQDDS